MGHLTVLYDACVLYPAPLRSLLMYLAMTGLFRARWTNEIHEEWMRSAVRDYPGLTRQDGERIRDLMNAHVLDCLVSGYETLIPSLELPDPNDRHVLAAAIHCGADVILTFNIKDFPGTILQSHGIEAQHPDEFIVQLLDQAPSDVCGAARSQRSSLKNPPLSVEEYLAALERQGIVRTVARLRQLGDHI